MSQGEADIILSIQAENGF